MIADPASRQRVLLCVEQRFDRTPDGVVWTSGHYSYAFLARYVTVGREVVLLARMRDVRERPDRAQRASGPGVSIAPLPYYVGFPGFLRTFVAVMWTAARESWRADAVIVRLPSMTALVTVFVGRWRNIPVLAEVIGDPDDVFAPGHFRHPLRALIRVSSRFMQSICCRHAEAVCYVSAALAEKYRTAGHPLVSADCAIPKEWFAVAARTNFVEGVIHIVAIGTMEVPYKRHDVLLRALRLALADPSRPDISVDLIGDGRIRQQLEGLAIELGIADRVTFHGFIASRDELRALLDRAHLLVHTSVTEGMPNVIIEAMACGLPCISTPVGGVPEILPKDCLIPVGDHQALSRELVRLAQSPGSLAKMSQRNLECSQQFSHEAWHGRFCGFIKYLTPRIGRSGSSE